MSSRSLIAAYVRSPFTPSGKGGLRGVRPDDLAARVVETLLARTNLPPETLEDLLLGCAFPEAEQGLNLGRFVALLAGLSPSIGGATVNRLCGSSMQAVHMAAGAISLGAGDAFLCVGVESMSRVPMMGFNPLLNPSLVSRFPGVALSMGDTAEVLAKKHLISRSEQEAFALRSHRLASAAQEEGRLAAELAPILTRDGVVSMDGSVRPETSLEALAGLPLAFDAAGTVTAGTSSPTSDGAAAVLVCSESYARQHNLSPLAAIKSIAISGCAPEEMGLGPVEASRKALARAGVSLDAVGIIELNEAFAAQALACLRVLDLPLESVNIDGGALALGHPLGATGARLVGKAASLLHREKGRYALATQCIGGGQGIATLLEAL